MKTRSLFLPILLLSFVASAATNEADKANLKPVDSVFGWKLGDQFPAALKTNELFQVANQMYVFRPKFGLPILDSNAWFVQILNDGRIHAVGTTAQSSSIRDFEQTQDRLVTELTEKYGLRSANESQDRIQKMKSYTFGTPERFVRLSTFIRTDLNYCNLDLMYYDGALVEVAEAERKARKDKIEAAKQAELKKSL